VGLIVGVVSHGEGVIVRNAQQKEWHGKYERDRWGRILYYQDDENESGQEEQKDKGEGREEKVTVKRKSMQESVPSDKSGRRPKLSKYFDPSKKYVPRIQRPEWIKVAVSGQLRILKGQKTHPSWLKLRNIDPEIELWLVR
jgi:hypothetical protein